MKKLNLSTVKRLHKYYWNKYIDYYNIISLDRCVDIDELKDNIGPQNIHSQCHLCQYAFNLAEKDDYCMNFCKHCPAVRKNPRRGCLDSRYRILQKLTKAKRQNRRKIINMCIQIRDVKFK